MKFILEHDAQGRTTPGLPLVVDVTPERRTEYPLACKCQWVFKLHPSARPELIERRLLLEQQADKDYAICFCLGRLAPESVVELLEGSVRPEPVIPKMDRPLCSWDTETTGIDSVNDRLVQLGVTVLYPDGTRKRWQTLINPEMPIPKEASDIHGITDEMVKDAPKFHDIAASFVGGLRGKDMLVFNGRGLDIPLVDTELRRAGLKLDLSGVRIVDAFRIFQEREPRNLEACVERYCGRPHRGAHGAQVDSEETLDAYMGMLGEYEDLRAMTLDEQEVYCWRDGHRPADAAGKLYIDSDGDLRYTMQKVRDVKVKDDAGWARWMKKQSNPPFPASTLECIDAELQRHGLL